MSGSAATAYSSSWSSARSGLSSTRRPSRTGWESNESVPPVIETPLEVKSHQHVVQDRCEPDARQNEKHNTGKERVEPGHPLSGSCAQRINRTHYDKKHRGIQEGIRPWKPFHPVVKRH